MITLFPYAQVEYSKETKKVKFKMQLIAETYSQEISVEVQMPEDAVKIIEQSSNLE